MKKAFLIPWKKIPLDKKSLLLQSRRPCDSCKILMIYALANAKATRIRKSICSLRSHIFFTHSCYGHEVTKRKANKFASLVTYDQISLILCVNCAKDCVEPGLSVSLVKNKLLKCRRNAVSDVI